MARNWVSTFSRWSKGSAKTETNRTEHTIRMIKKAIKASEKLKNRDIRFFLQGSYRNRVNVRQDSDVDIGIVCFDTFFDDYSQGATKRDVQFFIRKLSLSTI